MNNSFCNRMNHWLLLGISAILVLAAAPELAYGQRASRRDAYRQARSAEPNAAEQADRWAKYDIILQRNIFSRTRVSARRAEREQQRPAVVVPNPESYHLLKGVGQEDGQFIAFVEDTRSGIVLRLRQGDAAARGTVKALTLDTLEYEMEGQSVAVSIGSDLEGGQGAITAEQLMEWSQTAAPTAQPAEGSPAPAPSGDEAEILRKLMEQRRQQLGQ